MLFIQFSSVLQIFFFFFLPVYDNGGCVEYYVHIIFILIYLFISTEKDLLSSLPLSRTCSEAESAVVLAVYETRTNKYSSPSTPLPQPAAPLATNADFITAQAEKLYYNCNFAQCHRLTQEFVLVFTIYCFYCVCDFSTRCCHWMFFCCKLQWLCNLFSALYRCWMVGILIRLETYFLRSEIPKDKWQ